MAEFEYLRFDRDGDVLVVTVDKPDTTSTRLTPRCTTS
tara:strand:- start:125 stop:238 length:114 start_codon:yes stop_codon:yes gene_type:complete